MSIWVQFYLKLSRVLWLQPLTTGWTLWEVSAFIFAINRCLKQHTKGNPPTEQWCGASGLLSAFSRCPSPQRDRQVPLLPSLHTINSNGGNATKRWKCFTHKLISPTMWVCVGVLCLRRVVTHRNSCRLASSHNYNYKKEKFNNVCGGWWYES